MPYFLAENFRQLMDQLNSIENSQETHIIETPDEKDVEDLMKTERPSGINKNNINDIYDLIDFLDQFPELNTWRNHDAAYDDAFYEALPLDTLEAVTGLTASDLEQVTDKTEINQGSSFVNQNEVFIFGGD